MRSLWTKFTAAALMLAVVATSVASASTPVFSKIRNVQVTEDVFNPVQGETTDITFDVVRSTRLHILAENKATRNRISLTQTLDVTAGQSASFTWFGNNPNTANGTPVPAGEYLIYVLVPGLQPGTVDQTEIVEVTVQDTPQTQAPRITSMMAEPGTIRTDQGETTRVFFSFDQDADVSMRVQDSSGSTVRTFSNFAGTNQSAGSYAVTWDGTNNTGRDLPAGVYTFALTVRNNNGFDSATDVVTVVRGTNGGTAPNVTGLSVSPSPFDALDNETTNIRFTVDRTADVNVSISDSQGNFVRSFTGYNYNSYTARTHTVVWDGRNNSNLVLADGTYTVDVRARNSSGTDRETATVVIDNDNNTGNGPTITNLRVVPTTFDPRDGETTSIRFDVDEAANLTVEIVTFPSYISGDTLSTNIDPDLATTHRTFSNYDGDFYSAGSHAVTWNGRDDNNNLVAERTYYALVTASNTNGSDVDTTFVIVDDNGGTNNGLIIDLELDPSNDWDPTDEELEIDFELTDDVDDLEIFARRGSETIEILDDRNVDEDDYTENWDGTDEDDDYIDEGVWTIVIEADGQTATETINVEYEAPEFVDAFVTKDEFDNEQDEFTHLVFQLEEDAIVTVEVYEGNSRRMTLLDEEDVSGDEWITVLYDGLDDDGDEEDEGNDYEFRITAEHPAVDDLEAEETVDFDIDEDDVSNNRSNATNDYFDPVVFDADEDGRVTIHYCIDEDAEVSLDIYRGKSASGSVRATLLDDEDQNEGCHTLSWAGDDGDGDELREGVYSYKLVTRTSGSNRDTETGRFVIGDGDTDGPNPNPNPNPHGGNCGGYWDTVNLSGELCVAIDWATDQGIFHGNPDGSFRPYDNINRAEVLKVVLEAYEDHVVMLPADGSSLGFRDVNPSEWYMSYARTAKFYGMLHGYLNSTEARFYNPINRVEFLKFALEAADAFTNWETPGHEVSYFGDVNANEPTHDWFFDYAGVAYELGLYNTYYNTTTGNVDLRPGDMVQRGEVALMLYRMNNAGLMN